MRNKSRNFFVNLVYFLWDEYNVTCQQENIHKLLSERNRLNGEGEENK
jgi:hypothetical protein